MTIDPLTLSPENRAFVLNCLGIRVQVLPHGSPKPCMFYYDHMTLEFLRYPEFEWMEKDIDIILRMQCAERVFVPGVPVPMLFETAGEVDDVPYVGNGSVSILGDTPKWRGPPPTLYATGPLGELTRASPKRAFKRTPALAILWSPRTEGTAYTEEPSTSEHEVFYKLGFVDGHTLYDRKTRKYRIMFTAAGASEERRLDNSHNGHEKQELVPTDQIALLRPTPKHPLLPEIMQVHHKVKISDLTSPLHQLDVMETTCNEGGALADQPLLQAIDIARNLLERLDEVPPHHEDEAIMGRHDVFRKVLERVKALSRNATQDCRNKINPVVKDLLEKSRYEEIYSHPHMPGDERNKVHRHPRNQEVMIADLQELHKGALKSGDGTLISLTNAALSNLGVQPEHTHLSVHGQPGEHLAAQNKHNLELQGLLASCPSPLFEQIRTEISQKIKDGTLFTADQLKKLLEEAEHVLQTVHTRDKSMWNWRQERNDETAAGTCVRNIGRMNDRNEQTQCNNIYHGKDVWKVVLEKVKALKSHKEDFKCSFTDCLSIDNLPGPLALAMRTLSKDDLYTAAALADVHVAADRHHFEDVCTDTVVGRKGIRLKTGANFLEDTTTGITKALEEYAEERKHFAQHYPSDKAKACSEAAEALKVKVNRAHAVREIACKVSELQPDIKAQDLWENPDLLRSTITKSPYLLKKINASEPRATVGLALANPSPTGVLHSTTGPPSTSSTSGTGAVTSVVAPNPPLSNANVTSVGAPNPVSVPGQPPIQASVAPTQPSPAPVGATATQPAPASASASAPVGATQPGLLSPRHLTKHTEVAWPQTAFNETEKHTVLAEFHKNHVLVLPKYVQEAAANHPLVAITLLSKSMLWSPEVKTPIRLDEILDYLQVAKFK